MNRRITRLSLIQGLLAILLVTTPLPLVYSSPSLGTSHHIPHVTVVEGQSKNFSVGRIYNTGDISLNITAGWRQEYGNIALSVNVTPETKILQAGESYTIYITVEAAKVGYYNGTVQFTGETLTTEPGSPIRPAGSLPVQITIIEKSITPTQQPYETNWLLYAYMCIAIGLVVASLVYLIRFRERK